MWFFGKGSFIYDYGNVYCLMKIFCGDLIEMRYVFFEVGEEEEKLMKVILEKVYKEN